jgi:hypothetical protein
VQFFCTASLSVADGEQLRESDRFDIQSSEFGRALRHPFRLEANTLTISVTSL